MYYKVLLRSGELKRMATEREAQRCMRFRHLIAGIWRDVAMDKIVDISPGNVTMVRDE